QHSNRNNNNTMQNYCKTIGALATATALAAGNASALGYEDIDAEIHVGYDNRYLFRGIELGDDLVHAGLDVGTSVAGLDISAGAWYGSWNANNAGPTVDADELDIYAEVSKDLGFASLAVGYIYYTFPQGDTLTNPNFVQDAQEVYLSASREIFGVDASIAYFWDIETDNDGYTQLSLSKGFEIMPYVTLNTGTDFGYLAEEGDLVHITAKVGIDIEASENATISYYVAHSWSTSEGGTLAGGAGGVSTALYGGAENEFFFGGSVAVSF
ncbi:MAG: hypothetical protein NWS16_15590, partial [Akkermansiaceae bacterium]|nr:hypothetical protein [Akkermansiaceae bacterium]